MRARVVGKPFLTVQGEGSRVGRASVFARAAGCDLRCIWCDTPESLPDFDVALQQLTSTPQGRQVRDVDQLDYAGEVEAALLAAPGADLVITGGEPTLQRQWLRELIHVAHRLERCVTVETNFRRLDGLDLLATTDLISASPKVAVATVEGVTTLEKLVRLQIGCSLQAKIVVAGVADLDKAFKLAAPFQAQDRWVSLVPEASWLRSGWLDRAYRPDFIADLARHGLRWTAQMHPVLKLA